MTRKILIIISVFVLAGAGFLIWRQQAATAKAEQIEAEILKDLSEADVRMLLESQKLSDLETVNAVSATPASRKLFLDGLREHLALAAEARREGLAEAPNFKANLEYKKNILIAELYKAKLSAESGRLYAVAKEEVEPVLNDPKHAARLDADLKALHEIQTAVSKVKDENFVPQKLQGEALTRARENWARTKVLSDRAKADAEFIRRPEIALRLKVLEAGILSADYLRKHWLGKVKATESEVADFLKAHPEYDLAAKLKHAESVLRRAVANEEFSKLAAEYSEHRPSKQNGGTMAIETSLGEWSELVEASKGLKPGEVLGSFVQTEFGVHILKLLERSNAGTQKETIKLQHILFQNKFAQPGHDNPEIPAPFMTPKEIARLEIEKIKRDAFVAGILLKNSVSLPADFTLAE